MICGDRIYLVFTGDSRIMGVMKDSFVLSRGSRLGMFREEAFTLIELLVVIAIIAILAGLLVPSLARSKDRAQRTLDLNNVKQILVGSHLYASDSHDHLAHPVLGRELDGPGQLALRHGE